MSQLRSVWQRIDRRVVILVVVLIAVGGVLNVAASPRDTKTVTAHFSRAVSVYEGTDVRILGVNVGQVTDVIPEGESIRVEMEYDATYDVPAGAEAVIVTPTLVADRFIQLTPAYTEGEVMADGAVIELPETGVPVELDRIYGSLQSLTVALGTTAKGKDGHLDNLLSAAADAMAGQGAKGNQMITELSAAAETFGEGAEPLFEAVTQLAEFTKTLAGSDKLVKAFMKDLAGVSQTLAAESDELEKAVAAVAKAVGTVKSFVTDNRDALVRDVNKLSEVMTTINGQSESIDQALRAAPTALGNLVVSLDDDDGSASARFGVGGNIWDADGFLCSIVQNAPVGQVPKALKDIACNLFEQLLEPLTTKLPFIPPEYGSMIPSKNGGNGGKGGTPAQQAPTGYSGNHDPTLDGLLGGEG